MIPILSISFDDLGRSFVIGVLIIDGWCQLKIVFVGCRDLTGLLLVWRAIKVDFWTASTRRWATLKTSPVWTQWNIQDLSVSLKSKALWFWPLWTEKLSDLRPTFSQQNKFCLRSGPEKVPKARIQKLTNCLARSTLPLSSLINQTFLCLPTETCPFCPLLKWSNLIRFSKSTLLVFILVQLVICAFHSSFLLFLCFFKGFFCLPCLFWRIYELGCAGEFAFSLATKCEYEQKSWRALLYDVKQTY